MDTRYCARPGCGSPAAATMAYDYAGRTVWLHRPGSEPDAAAAWGLCPAHADGLRVPLGWAREDRRAPAPAPAPALEPAPAPAQAPGAGAGAGAAWLDRPGAYPPRRPPLTPA